MPRRSEPDPLARAVGQRIRQLRGEAGISRHALMVAAGLSSIGYISDVEGGLAMPTLTTLEKLSRALNVMVLDLLVSPSPATLRERVVDASRVAPDSMLRRWLREATEHRAKGPARRARST